MELRNVEIIELLKVLAYQSTAESIDSDYEKAKAGLSEVIKSASDILSVNPDEHPFVNLHDLRDARQNELLKFTDGQLVRLLADVLTEFVRSVTLNGRR